MMVNTFGLGVRVLAVGALLAALAWLPTEPPSNWRIIQVWPSVVAALAVVFALSAVGTLTPRNPVQNAVACPPAKARGSAVLARTEEISA